MPLDSYVSQPPRSEDWGLNKAYGWKLKRCWRPHTCFLTGKQLWGRRAYHATRMVTGPGTPVFEDYWIEKYQFLLWRLGDVCND